MVNNGVVASSSSFSQYVEVREVPKAAKKASKLTFNASPEPVKKGRTMTAAGTLKRGTRSMANTVVKLQFHKPGKSYYTVTTTRTNASGRFSRGVSTVRGTGTWRAVYGGNSTTKSSVSSGDYVVVK